MQIRDVQLKNNVIMAPMAGITNQAFREIILSQGIGMVYSEMVSDKAIVYRNQKTLKMLEVGENEHPFAMQLFGHDIDSMVQAAMYIDQNTNCDTIDINMGCPVNKVTSNQAGSALMKEPEHVSVLLKEIIDHVKKPVTVKMRSGWNHESINATEIAQRCEQAGVSAVAVHARTRTQMYEGKADWSVIKQVKDAISIPVIGNGDIKCYQDMKRMIEETGCDAVMVGRALLGNPWLVQELLNEGNVIINPDERLNMLLLHAEKLIQLKGERIAIKEMRGQAGWYLAGLPHNNRMKNILSKVITHQDIIYVTEEYRKIIYLDTDIQKDAIEQLENNRGLW